MLAGHVAYQQGDETIHPDRLLEAIGLVRGETRATGVRSDARSVGFDLSSTGG